MRLKLTIVKSMQQMETVENVMKNIKLSIKSVNSLWLFQIASNTSQLIDFNASNAVKDLSYQADNATKSHYLKIVKNGTKRESHAPNVKPNLFSTSQAGNVRNKLFTVRNTLRLDNVSHVLTTTK